MTAPLIHFSRKPLTFVYSTKAHLMDDEQFKPIGLWVSVGDGVDSWLEWCRGESFRLECLTHATEVVLRDDTNVLRISSVGELDAFDDQFSIQTPFSRIRWRDVAARHQGIIIAPYLWERRFGEKCSWYYPWDCASGCIWDASAVAELRSMAVREVAEIGEAA